MADPKDKGEDKYTYLSGFGNEHATEAAGYEGALPEGQNAPQKCNFGLYAEQLSGTAFTVPRSHNLRTWFYRIRPSVVHRPFKKLDADFAPLMDNDFSKCEPEPNQMRWSPFPLPDGGEKRTFVQGLRTICGAGDPSTKSGLAIYYYSCNESMGNESFYNSDGDYLIVPEKGALDIRTEMGFLHVRPSEICVIPRGIQFQVRVEGATRGYVCECYTGHYELPNLGPIGANGLALPRDFLAPTAAFEDTDGVEWRVVSKFQNRLFMTPRTSSPFDVVAWHGNYYPFKYDLDKFCPMNTVLFDHADPSIFTVLTVPTTSPGTAAIDFVIFPPRWITAEHTFRPPYYHRNCMSEFMGLIRGVYEAKEEGFMPGGGSLHSCMTPHGPDAATFEKASDCPMKPARLPDTTMAFMFESSYLFGITEHAQTTQVQENYWECWQGLKKHFVKKD